MLQQFHLGGWIRQESLQFHDLCYPPVRRHTQQHLRIRRYLRFPNMYKGAVGVAESSCRRSGACDCLPGRGHVADPGEVTTACYVEIVIFGLAVPRLEPRDLREMWAIARDWGNGRERQAHPGILIANQNLAAVLLKTIQLPVRSRQI